MGSGGSRAAKAGCDDERFLTEELYVDLLQRVHTAELVQFMVNLIEDEGFVVVGGVVLHYVIHWEGRGDFRRTVRTQAFLRQQFSLPAGLRLTLGWHAGESKLALRGNWKHVPAFGTRKFTTSILSK